MGWLKKFFFGEEKQETTVEKQLEGSLEDLKQGRVTEVSLCLLCSQPILSTDNTREINGQIFHKRCFKKMKKGVAQGQSIEEVVQKAQND